MRHANLLKEKLTNSFIYLLTYSLTHKYINTHTHIHKLNTHQVITSVTNSSSPNTPTNHPVNRTKIKKARDSPARGSTKHNTDIKSMYFV